MSDSAASCLFAVDLTAAATPLCQPWQGCVGSGHAMLALRADWRHDPASCRAAATIERVDDDHADPQRSWQGMGSPEYLRPTQVQMLMDASRVVAQPLAIRQERGRASVDVVLAPRSVNLVHVSWERAS